MDVIYREIQLVNILPEESLQRLKNVEASEDNGYTCNLLE
jgi:hypothetical protein